jgi:hypothetical protein
MSRMPRSRQAVPENVKLLHGPYKAPRLKVGDRAHCLFKRGLVEVKYWTEARIPWPRGVPVGKRGHPTHIVNDELARAIRTEAAVAVRFWWGVSKGVVWRWRTALGVALMDAPATRRVIWLNARAGGQTNHRNAVERGLPLHELHKLPWWAPPRKARQGLRGKPR